MNLNSSSIIERVPVLKFWITPNPGLNTSCCEWLILPVFSGTNAAWKEAWEHAAGVVANPKLIRTRAKCHSLNPLHLNPACARREREREKKRDCQKPIVAVSLAVGLVFPSAKRSPQPNSRGCKNDPNVASWRRNKRWLQGDRVSPGVKASEGPLATWVCSSLLVSTLGFHTHETPTGRNRKKITNVPP